MSGAVSSVIDAVSDAISDVGDFVSDVVDITVDVINVLWDYNIKLIKDPTSILEDPMKVITLAIAVVMAPATGGLSLVAWYAVNSGAITQTVVSMSEKGWINESHVAVVATVANITAMVLGAYGSGYVPGSGAVGTIQALEAIGVSSQTALQIGLIVQEIEYSVYTTIALKAYDVGSSLYGIFQSYNQSLALEKSYKEAQAAFEMWWKNFQNKQAQEDNFISSFVTGSYFKKLPGQPMFNINLAGHEQYVCTDVQKPSYWIEQNKPYVEDAEISRLMWANKNYDKAGGSNFISIQTDYTMLKSQY